MREKFLLSHMDFYENCVYAKFLAESTQFLSKKEEFLLLVERKSLIGRQNQKKSLSGRQMLENIRKIVTGEEKNLYRHNLVVSF